MDASGQKRVLIVDDEEVVRSLCIRLLEPLGYAVDVAADGRQALSCLEKQPIDLVITDYRMPGDIDGLELAQIVKQRFVHTQLILMTAFPAVDTAVEMLRIGARDFLVKPFDQAVLIKCVESSFAKPQAA